MDNIIIVIALNPSPGSLLFEGRAWDKGYTAVGVILSQAVEDAESQLTTAAAACPITGAL